MLNIKTNKQRVEDIMKALDDEIELYTNLRKDYLGFVDSSKDIDTKDFHMRMAKEYDHILAAFNDFKKRIENNCL